MAEIDKRRLPMIQINIGKIEIGNVTIKGEENALPKENESSQVKSNPIKRIFITLISLCVSQIAKLWQ